MDEEDLRKWSSQMYRQIKKLDNRKYRILARCCRASINGSVELTPYYDSILMTTYTPKLVFCPECGRRLEFDVDDDRDR